MLKVFLHIIEEINEIIHLNNLPAFFVYFPVPNRNFCNLCFFLVLAVIKHASRHKTFWLLSALGKFTNVKTIFKLQQPLSKAQRSKNYYEKLKENTKKAVVQHTT